MMVVLVLRSRPVLLSATEEHYRSVSVTVTKSGSFIETWLPMHAFLDSETLRSSNLDFIAVRSATEWDFEINRDTIFH